jgi:hypothetical protein
MVTLLTLPAVDALTPIDGVALAQTIGAQFV